MSAEYVALNDVGAFLLDVEALPDTITYGPW